MKVTQVSLTFIPLCSQDLGLVSSWSAMVLLNLSSDNPEPFILVGIPGLEHAHVWIGIPFCIVYVVAIVGNCILLYLILVERSLHEPMFFFLSMLAMTDLTLSTAGVPKTLSIFWLGAREITLPGCLTQMVFLHYSFVLDSAILMAMAFDRYVAICSPLRYNTILTPKTIIKIVVGLSFHSFCIILPVVFLLTRLPFCRTRIIPYTYCEHIGVARLACADISVNIWYGFCVPIMTVISDVILIAASYTHILCAVLPPLPRSPPEGPGHLWFPCLCHPHVLYTCHFLHPCPPLWTQCLPHFPHHICQPLHCYPTCPQPHCLWSEDQADQRKGHHFIFYKVYIIMFHCAMEKLREVFNVY